MEQVQQQIGQRLRQARQQRGWSLDRTARETGVSKAMLGQIERGESSPTVATLWKIATGFKLSLSSFLEVAEPAGERPVIRRVAESSLQESEQLQFFPLFPFDPAFGFELFQIALEPGQEHLSEPHDEGVTEHVIVVSGAMEVLAGGDWHPLACGEAIRFAANQPHGYRNLGAEKALFHNLIHYR
ncbi:helix-turn-helix domain-containing protein [Marinobacterium arenosum]|uniref:helix-turn-helix domain-containing protein n=1 Tax=Marinobacterium arenosum TaxID=2862496 RepID=UPI001C955F77|nr:helix-turn-helix domain-containing protein [Marinobacterium arenosum]MBY4676186.1 helix-turn-helix domain-containing protein [Marinobacterium arenosum]